MQGEVNRLAANNVALRNEVVAVRANPALALASYLTLDPKPDVGVTGPNLVFHGVNVHTVSSSVATNDDGTPGGWAT